METQDRLYRSQTSKVFGGVAGGLADYFDIDVVLARVAFVLLVMFGGSGGLIYIVLWIVIPKQPTNYSTYTNYQNKSENQQTTGDRTDNNQGEVEVIYENKPVKQSNTGLIAGVILIFLGMLFLGDRLLPWYNLADLWPLILVFIGIFIIKPDIFKPSKKQSHEI